MGKTETAERFVRSFLDKNLNDKYTYHSLAHTVDVVHRVHNYSRLHELDKNISELLAVTAWFHDTGIPIDYNDHEEKSIEIFRLFARTHGFTESDILFVCRAIRATKLPQTASSICEKIICDADLDYLGRTDFEKISQSLRQEWINLNTLSKISVEEFDRKQITFLSNHSYHLDVAKLLRDHGKQRNLKRIIQRVSKP